MTKRDHDHARGREKTPKEATNRRPYRSPALTKYGAIRDLTTGGSGPMVEGAAMTSPTKRP